MKRTPRRRREVLIEMEMEMEMDLYVYLRLAVPFYVLLGTHLEFLIFHGHKVGKNKISRRGGQEE